MTYNSALQITKDTSLEQAKREHWGDEWIAYAAFVCVVEFDRQYGLIANYAEYDETED